MLTVVRSEDTAHYTDAVSIKLFTQSSASVAAGETLFSRAPATWKYTGLVLCCPPSHLPGFLMSAGAASRDHHRGPPSQPATVLRSLCLCCFAAPSLPSFSGPGQWGLCKWTDLTFWAPSFLHLELVLPWELFCPPWVPFLFPGNVQMGPFTFWTHHHNLTPACPLLVFALKCPDKGFVSLGEGAHLVLSQLFHNLLIMWGYKLPCYAVCNACVAPVVRSCFQLQNLSKEFVEE